MPGIFDPLVPHSAIDPLQQWLEKRRLDQSVGEAQLKGFGSGALEGLRGLTSPLCPECGQSKAQNSKQQSSS